MGRPEAGPGPGTVASAHDQLAGTVPPFLASVAAWASDSTICRSRSRQTGMLPTRLASVAAFSKSSTIPGRQQTSAAPGETDEASTPAARSTG